MNTTHTHQDCTRALTKDFVRESCEQRSARLEVAPFGLAIYLLNNRSSDLIYCNGRFQAAIDTLESSLPQTSAFYLVDSTIDMISHRQLDIFLTDPNAFRLRLEINHTAEPDNTLWSLVYMRKVIIQSAHLLIVSLREGKPFYRRYSEHLGPNSHHSDLMSEESFRGFVESIRGFIQSDYMLSVMKRPNRHLQD